MCKQKKRRQKITSNATVKPAQKTRTKRRKPKYLSLSLKLSPQKNYKKTKLMTHKKQKLQLNLFPLHPEKQAHHSSSSEDMHDQDDNNNNNNNNNNSVIDASFIFDTATDSTTTLDGLLTASEEGPLSPPTMVTYGKSTDESGECSNYGLVRTAMRCKERDASEERWVSYSEVVDSKKMEIKEEEGSSCVDDDGDDESAWRVMQGQQKKKRLLLDLKLDYQEIMNAWSDKAPLFVDGESPQTVPDLLLDPNKLIDAWGNDGNLCSVPEMTGNVGSFKVDELGCKEGWNREHREASVLRYKEKRQNRLFAKRIRYEVRKLNAEKRPRMKGRFVKRNSEA